MKIPESGNTWIKFSTMGIQMGATIYLGSLLGEWVASKFPESSLPIHQLISLFAIFGAIFTMILQVINHTKEEEKRKK